ncbi:hypothetical protein [Pseudodesulfovibrio tunisiensis]|uniref:hypothetical protein n=1 Tax=Pseudodesulfovibrio tunisiensis TaxID=463192 RepID=UPI001FB37DEB|nr:hypothetical protein [Pseudodesulfovibrio tunisiensis]
MAKKAPAFQIYPDDWLSDTRLMQASDATQGRWMRTLCRMWRNPQRGRLDGPGTSICKALGMFPAEFLEFVLEIIQYGFADLSIDGEWVIKEGEFTGAGVTEALHGNAKSNAEVTLCNAKITLINRRMWREQKVNNSNAKRQRRYRAKHSSDMEVTPPSPSPTPSPTPEDTNTSSSKLQESSSPTKRMPEDFLGGGDPPSSRPVKTDSPSKGRPSRQGFLACWQVYPLKQGEEAAWREWCRLEDNGTLEEPWAIREHILLMAQEDGRFTRCPPKFENYLRDKRWNDTPYKAPQDGSALVSGMPQAKTQAQQNAQNRQRLAKALNQARSQRENQQRQNARGNCGSGFELPGGDDGTGRNCGFAPDLGGGPRALEREAVS